MKIKPIKDEIQYEDTLGRIYELMQVELNEGSKESDEVEVLSMLVKDYELKNYPMPKLKSIDAIKYKMEQMNMTEAQLVEVLGTRSRKSEILSGKRKLSLTMIRKINKVMSIPAEVLIQAY
jgi:HTH-type transcriptional regulator/antitoxin HigA